MHCAPFFAYGMIFVYIFESALNVKEFNDDMDLVNIMNYI